MPKGENPNSRSNLIAGKNKKPNSKKTSLQISDSAKAIAQKLGNGNMTKGIEQSLNLYEETIQDQVFLNSSVLPRVKLLLKAITKSGSRYCDVAEALLYELSK